MTKIFSVFTIFLAFLIPNKDIKINNKNCELIIADSVSDAPINTYFINVRWANDVTNSRKAQIRQELQLYYGKSPLEGYNQDGSMIWYFDLNRMSNSIAPPSVSYQTKSNIIHQKIEDTQETIPD